jgi:hypothetical protein
MSRMLLERAFDLARSGQVQSLEELSRKLIAEGHIAVLSHLAAPTLRRQLSTTIKAAREPDPTRACQQKPSGAKPSWSEEDDARLRALGPNPWERTKLAAEIGRTRGAVDSRMARLGLLPPKRSTAADSESKRNADVAPPA